MALARRTLIVIMALLMIGCAATRPSSKADKGTAMLDIMNLSRLSSVRVSSVTGNSRGTGFFIRDSYVVTCFHVIAAMRQNGTHIELNIFNDLKITTLDGEEIEATCVSIPTDSDPAPLQYDFAVLKLAHKPARPTVVKIATDEDAVSLGADVTFAGYPLATPGVVTHRGMISGWSAKKDLIFIQGAINKGNSGGALVSSEGEAVGIVSMREGGIGKGLDDLVNYIDATAAHGNVQIMGVDPLQATKEIVTTLNTYISTGIGYARSIRFLCEWLGRTNIL